MSPARKRATKSAKKTTKKPTRKASAKKAPKATAKKVAKAGAKKKAPAKKAPAKKAAPKKTARKPAGKTEKREVKKTAAKRRAPASPPRSSGKAAPKPAARRARAKRRESKAGVARPLESASRKPGLGAKWACFSCGAKFYDLNRPDPICPKCQTDQRDQPAKSAAAPSPRPARRPAPPPITRLLDEEETPDAAFNDDRDGEAAAELDLGKLDGDAEYLDDAEFTDESDD